ncbi:MAG TPA: hypothetical protein V6C89_16155 [Drouetiella sp.]|jgi:hypothetical protein
MANAEFVSPSEIQKAADAPVPHVNQEVATLMMDRNTARIPQDNGGAHSANAHLPGLTLESSGGDYAAGQHNHSNSGRSSR